MTSVAVEYALSQGLIRCSDSALPAYRGAEQEASPAAIAIESAAARTRLHGAWLRAESRRRVCISTYTNI